MEIHELKNFHVSWCWYVGKVYPILMVGLLLLSGCPTFVVEDPVKPVPVHSAYCEGSEWSDDSSVSSVPVPIVAFFFPHSHMYVIEPENYLRQCGRLSQLVNREVIVSRNACIPASLTRLITLGIWQWCPVHVVWEADIVQDGM